MSRVYGKATSDSLIVHRDLDKAVIIYASPKKDIVFELLALKKHKCGKYIDITKTFLTNPIFLKYSYLSICGNSEANAKTVGNENLDGINEK